MRDWISVRWASPGGGARFGGVTPPLEWMHSPGLANLDVRYSAARTCCSASYQGALNRGLTSQEGNRDMSFTATTAYTGLTASMQVDPEAPHPDEAASVSSLAVSISNARCSSRPGAIEWVPDRERTVVPDAMATLCRRCESRQQCLIWALGGREVGYWAATTTADRKRMSELGETSVEAADRMQRLARSAETAGALHPAGEGSYWWYRRRHCRCTECMRANAKARAEERAKARCRTGVAA